MVDVAAVREVDLDDGRGEIEEEEEEQELFRLLRGPAKHALCSCITGEGSPPLKLLFGAIACAGSGEIGGIPVEHMRADTLTNLDLADYRKEAIGPEGAMLVASFIPVMGALTKLSLAENNLGEEGTKAICEALEKNETLKELDLHGGYPSFNNIGGAAGVKHVAKMLGVNGALKVLILSSNEIGGYWHFREAKTVYTPEGPRAFADAFLVNGALTQVLALSDPPKTAFSVTLTFAFLSNRISAEHIKQPAVRPR